MSVANKIHLAVEPREPVDLQEPLLPEGFEDLERFKDWMLESEGERNVKRLKSEYSALKDFYTVMVARHPQWIVEIDKYDVHAMPPQAHRLFLLTLSLMEVAPAVEYFQSADLKDAVPAERVQILSSRYDIAQ